MNNDISFYHLKENGREEKSIQFLTTKQELKLRITTYTFPAYTDQEAERNNT